MGFDVSHSLLSYAAEKTDGRLTDWVRGNAEALPFADSSFDRVVMSFVLHQIRDKAQAVGEAFRVLGPNGLILIRTVAPEAARERVPFRFFPRVAEAEAARMPVLADIRYMLSEAGFGNICTEVVERRREVDMAGIVGSLKNRSRPSYKMLTEDELAEGIANIEREWKQGGNQLIDPRPTTFITGAKDDGEWR